MQVHHLETKESLASCMRWMQFPTVRNTFMFNYRSYQPHFNHTYISKVQQNRYTLPLFQQIFIIMYINLCMYLLILTTDHERLKSANVRIEVKLSLEKLNYCWLQRQTLQANNKFKQHAMHPVSLFCLICHSGRKLGLGKFYRGNADTICYLENHY